LSKRQHDDGRGNILSAELEHESCPFKAGEFRERAWDGVFIGYRTEKTGELGVQHKEMKKKRG
jgi:hypothetical protein